MSEQSTSKAQSRAAPTELKHRGANRSTKVAGKLKILPEQPDLPPLVVNKNAQLKGPPRDHEESVGTTGDSDEGDDENDDDEQEDVEVRACSSGPLDMD